MPGGRFARRSGTFRTLRGLPIMDRTLQFVQLAAVERHVTEYARRVEWQRHRIAELERAGHPTAESRALLETFLRAQAIHEQQLIRIRGALAGAG